MDALSMPQPDMVVALGYSQRACCAPCTCYRCMLLNLWSRRLPHQHPKSKTETPSRNGDLTENYLAGPRAAKSIKPHLNFGAWDGPTCLCFLVVSLSGVGVRPHPNANKKGREVPPNSTQLLNSTYLSHSRSINESRTESKDGCHCVREIQN